VGFNLGGFNSGGGGGGASGITIGDSITGGTINRVLYEDSSNNIAESADMIWDASASDGRGSLIIGTSGNTTAGRVHIKNTNDTNLTPALFIEHKTTNPIVSTGAFTISETTDNTFAGAFAGTFTTTGSGNSEAIALALQSSGANTKNTALRLRYENGTNNVAIESWNGRSIFGGTTLPTARIEIVGEGIGTGITLKTTNNLGSDTFTLLDNGEATFSGNINASKFIMNVQETYTPINVTTNRAYDANITTLDEIADVLRTLIADLQTVGLIN